MGNQAGERDCFASRMKWAAAAAASLAGLMASPRRDRAAETEAASSPRFAEPISVALLTVNYRTMMECGLLDRQLRGEHAAESDQTN